MQRSITLGATFLFVLAISAQPVLDASVIPTPGGGVTYVLCPSVNLTGTGPNAVWDASGAMTTGTEVVGFGDPSAASAGDAFPASDVVEVFNAFQTFIDAQPDGIYSLGQYYEAQNITAVYADPLRMLALPCALDTAWADGFAGGYTYAGNNYQLEGIDSSRATGYGTLQLPWGDVGNVLRVENTEVYNEMAPGFTYQLNTAAVYYYKPGVPLFVAKSVHATSVVNGSPSGTQNGFFYLDESSIGMNEQASHVLGVQVVPNPASDQAAVLLTATGRGTLEVIDGQGRVQQRKDLGVLAPGLSRAELDVAQLPPGAYTAIVRTASGEQGVAHFVVVR